MNRIYVVVANRVEARIYETEGRKLRLHEDLRHPEGHLQPHEIDSDRQGRMFDRKGHRGHSMQQKVQPHEQDAIRFGKQIADRLEHARLEGVHGFVLVAEPHFLGVLRAQLPHKTAELVVGSVPKELLRATDGDIVAAVSEILPALAPER